MKIAFMIWLAGCLIFGSYHILGYLLYKKSVYRWGIPVNNTYSQFENVLGVQKGFVVGFDSGKFVQYIYYGVDNGVPRVLTCCYDNIKEIDLNNDGMKEIIYFRNTELTSTVIQITRGNEIYQYNVKEDIINKVYSLAGISPDYLNNIQVVYDEKINAIKFSTGPVETKEGYIQGYLFW